MNSCANTTTNPNKKEIQKTVYASDIIPFFDHWKLILGDGSSAGFVNNFENKNFFYTTKDSISDRIVYKAPNGGDIQKQYKDGNYAEVCFKQQAFL